MNESRIDKLIIEAYEALLQKSEEVYAEEIVQKIADWGDCDGVDYWKEVSPHFGTDSAELFERTCKYVMESARYGCEGKLEGKLEGLYQEGE